MRAVATYFEQVPKTVIEKILAQQEPPAENDIGSDKAVVKRTANNAPSRTKLRNSRP